MSSNKSRKNVGRKTKHGRPTGRREVLEKYKAIGVDTLVRGTLKHEAIQDRVLGSAFTGPSFIVPIPAEERRRTNRLTLQDQLLSLGHEESREGAEHEAREECREMKDEIFRDEMRERAEKSGLEWYFFELPWGLEDIDWFGINWGHLNGEFMANFQEVVEQSREQAREGGSYISFEQATWMAAPHSGEGCFVCKQMVKYGAEGPCQ